MRPGEEFEITVSQYDLGSRDFTNTHLCVGLSRATDGSKVSIA